MKAKDVFLLIGGLALGILVGWLILWAVGVIPGLQTGTTRAVLEVGKPVPDFVLTNLDGKSVHMSEYKGQAVLINFWATWCIPCKDEMPLLEQKYQQFIPDLVVLGVNYQEGKIIASRFVEENGITFPILMDESGQVSALYAVRGFPTSFFVDKDGILRSEHIGQVSDEVIGKYLVSIGIKPK